MPGQTMEIDSQWVMDISTRLAALPAIEDHLRRVNDSIAKSALTVHALDQRVVNLDTRVTILETLGKNLGKLAVNNERRKEARWQILLSSGVRIGEAIIIAYLLFQLALR